VAVGIAGCIACVKLLPERYAVNAPIAHMLFGVGGEAPPGAAFGERLRVPAAFRMGLYAADLPGARFLHVTPSGVLLVSTPRSGRVWRLAPDADGDGASDGAEVLLEGLRRPHGLATWEGWLYVAETDGVGRVRFDAREGRTTGSYARVVDGLPEGGNHWTRTVGFGPDGWMYVSIGSSCNVCFEEDPRRAAIVRYRPDGTGEEIHATGLRNAVGFAWRPGTDELYATDNGRDLLGDDFPPCELNRVVADGFYGWPVANGDRVPDPDLGAGHAERIRASIPPVHAFAAHNAPLGITFLQHPEQPAAWRGAALVALHGSWNRTEKDGYEVVSLHWREDGAIEERPFATGFERDGDVIGRPVDVAEGPDGAIYVSDDYAGAVYRVIRREAAAAGAPGLPAAAVRPGGGGADTGASESAATGRPAAGRALYRTHDCASCHEAERAAPGVVPLPLKDLAARYDEASLAAYLATPNPPMPVAPLDAAERRDLAAHLLERFP